MKHKDINTSPAFSLGLTVKIPNIPGALGELCVVIGKAGGNIVALEGFEVEGSHLIEELLVNCRDEKHTQKILKVVGGMKDIELMESYDRTFHLHEGGKIEVRSLLPLENQDQLSMAYTPGVARICQSISDSPDLARKYTIKQNTVAIVTDGTAVLGLGNIGPKAALPVMEGKALLFKEFSGVDAFPICLDVKTPREVIETVERIAPVFGGINLEDIAAPACFEIEESLNKSLDIPVFHDDQHGTAIVTLAALENALKIVDKEMSNISVVISGTGAAGVAIGKILQSVGVQNIVGTDKDGIINADLKDLAPGKAWFGEHTNPEKRQGSLADALVGADVFVGVSAGNIVDAENVQTMSKRPIIFAMANPNPEVRPEQIEDMAAVIATGRSDYPNQINNVLAFPGVFRGALDAEATAITEEMKLAAAEAIASCVSTEALSPSYIIPSVFDKRVVERVAKSVAETCAVSQNKSNELK